MYWTACTRVRPLSRCLAVSVDRPSELGLPEPRYSVCPALPAEGSAQICFTGEARNGSQGLCVVRRRALDRGRAPAVPARTAEARQGGLLMRGHLACSTSVTRRPKDLAPDAYTSTHRAHFLRVGCAGRLARHIPALRHHADAHPGREPRPEALHPAVQPDKAQAPVQPVRHHRRWR